MHNRRHVEACADEHRTEPGLSAQEQQLKAFSGRFCQQEIDASEISAGSIEAVDEADPDWVGGLQKNNWDRLGRRFGSLSELAPIANPL